MHDETKIHETPPAAPVDLPIDQRLRGRFLEAAEVMLAGVELPEVSAPTAAALVTAAADAVRAANTLRGWRLRELLEQPRDVEAAADREEERDQVAAFLYLCADRSGVPFTSALEGLGVIADQRGSFADFDGPRLERCRALADRILSPPSRPST